MIGQLVEVRVMQAPKRTSQTTASDWYDQHKGARRMTWHREAMKDVGTCDKSEGAGNQAVISESPNGATHPQGYFTLNA